MKKNFMKKLATTVALALTVTTIVPGNGTAQAAGTQSLSANSVTLYTGSAYDFNVKNSSSAYSYTYTSADKDVVTVNSKSGIVSAKSNGATKISCKIVNKKTNKTLKTLTATVTVVAKMAANTKDITLNEQETFDINMNKAITSVYSYRYTTSDAAVATVTSSTGIVTGVKEGTATITVTVTNKSTKKSNKITIPVKVNPGKLTFTAKQTHPNKVELAINPGKEEITTIKADEIVIKDADGVPNYVKEVKLSADKKTATVETYSNFANDVKYTVTYKETAADFNAKLGKAAKVVLENQTVQAGAATKIKMNIYDANGINITSDDELSKVSVTMDLQAGYINDSGATKEITLYNIGDKAVVSAQYHTNEFNSNGVETLIEANKVTVNAVEKVAKIVKYGRHSVVKSNAKVNWDKVNHILPIGDYDSVLKVEVKDADGNDISSRAEFESKDTNVLTVGADGALIPQKVGTGYVKVTVDEVTQVFAITVGQQSKLSALTADKSNITVSANVGGEAVRIEAKDQYGNDITDMVNFRVDAPSQFDVKGNSGDFTIKSSATGTATVKIIAEYGETTLTRPITVRTVTTTNTEVKSWKPVVSTNTLDLGKGQTKVKVRLDGMNSSGVKVSTPDLSSIDIKAPNGRIYQVTKDGAPAGIETATGSALIDVANFTKVDDAGYVTLNFGEVNNNVVSGSCMLGTYTITLRTKTDAVDKDGKPVYKDAKSTITVNDSVSTAVSVTNKTTPTTIEIGKFNPTDLGTAIFSAKVGDDSYNVALNDYTIDGKVANFVPSVGDEVLVAVKSLKITNGSKTIIKEVNRTVKLKVIANK